MNRLIIGCDPDSEKHGISIFSGGSLVALSSMRLIDIIELIHENSHKDIVFHIENVCGNNAPFIKSGVKNQRAGTAISRGLGKCQQAQIELERICEHYGINVVKHKISKMCNEDTRSAAFFGWLGSNK